MGLRACSLVGAVVGAGLHEAAVPGWRRAPVDSFQSLNRGRSRTGSASLPLLLTTVGRRVWRCKLAVH